jgi:RNA polymerase sigma-70 factor (ECF subfamily)
MSEQEQREWILGALARYEQPLLRFAGQWVGPVHARDVVQDTFLALCKARRADIEHRLVQWLFVVCRNRAIDLQRQRSRLSALDDTHGDVGEVLADALEQQQSLSRVEQIIEELPAKQRQAVLLKFSAGMSYRQIAEVMELTVSHVGVLLHKAIKSVRERLNEEVAMQEDES